MTLDKVGEDKLVKMRQKKNLNKVVVQSAGPSTLTLKRI